jgi:hypothetical protein
MKRRNPNVAADAGSKSPVADPRPMELVGMIIDQTCINTIRTLAMSAVQQDPKHQPVEQMASLRAIGPRLRTGGSC